MNKITISSIVLSMALFSGHALSINSNYVDDISTDIPQIELEKTSESENISMLFNAPILQSECKITGNSQGCTANFVCPQNQEITAVKVGCNLEWGSVTDSQMNSVRWGKMNILRETDNRINDSFCRIDTDREKRGGSHSITTPIGKTAVSMSCKEHDKNGGDCHIKAQFICSNR